MDKERLEAMGAEALVEELSDRLDQMGEEGFDPDVVDAYLGGSGPRSPRGSGFVCTPLKRIFVPDMPTSSRPQPSR